MGCWLFLISHMRILGALLPLSLREMATHWSEHGRQTGWPQTLAEEAVFFRRFWEQLGRHCQLSTAAVQALIAWDYKEVLRPFDEARAVLAHLKEHGFKIGVLSNFSLASLEPSLEHLGLSAYVDTACAATVIGVSKPHPDAYRIVADRLGVPASDCLFIDDEAEHVQGAQAVGMHACLLERDGRTVRQGDSLWRITSLFDIIEPNVFVQHQAR